MKKLSELLLWGLVVIMSWPLQGQVVPLLEKSYGDKADNFMQYAIESRDGGILAVGHTESPYWGGYDALLIKVDGQGTFAFRASMGIEKGDDFGRTVAEDPLGRLVVGGYTQMQDGFTESWLSCRGPNGKEEVWTKKIATGKGRYAIEDILLDNEHDYLFCAGIYDSQPWFASVGLDGELIRAATITGPLAKIEARDIRMCRIGDYFYLFGNGLFLANEGRRLPFILKLDASGALIEYVTFPDYNVTSTGQIIPLGEDALGMVGAIQNKGSREDIFYLRINTSLDKRTHIFQQYRGPDFDEGAGLAQLGPGALAIAGSTLSHGKGARKEDFLLLKIDENGEREKVEPDFFGNKFEERARVLILKNDASLWLCGTRDEGNSLLSNFDFTFLCLKQGQAPEALSANMPSSLRVTPVNNAAGRKLQAGGQRQALSFYLQNDSEQPLAGLKVETRCLDSRNGGLQFEPSIRLPRLEPGRKERFTIPIWAPAGAPEGSCRLESRILDSAGRQLWSAEEMVVIQAPDVPELALVGYFLEGNTGGEARKGQPVKVRMVFENQGKATSIPAPLSVALPEGVSYVGDYNPEIPPIQPGGRYEASLFLDVPRSFEPEQLVLNVYFQDAPDRESAKSTIVSTIHAPEEEALPEAALPSAANPLSLVVVWNNDFGTEIVTSVREEYEINAIAISNRELSLHEFFVIHNDQRFSLAGVKMDEVKLGKQGVGQNKFKLYFSYKVKLQPGKNVLSVEVKDGELEDRTEPLLVEYRAYDKGTLYVLSVGVPDASGNLQYTAKDAEDFAALFKGQKGKIYGEVEVEVLNTPDNTDGQDITRALSRFNTLYRRQNLSEKDGIVLFFSSHGFIGDNGEFRLKCNEFDPFDKVRTSLDFEKDLVQRLDTLPCQKFVFVDACKSGSIDAAFAGRKGGTDDYSYSDAQTKVMTAARAVHALASCAPGEFSYEDRLWENGAFTKALKNILSNEGLCKQLDTDGDRALSFLEVYGPLKETVKDLMKKAKRKESQTPYIPRKQLQDNVPFFAF